MTEGIGKFLRDIVISIGVFVPLMNYVYHLLQSHPRGVNLLHLPMGDVLALLVLTLAPLALLRLVYAPYCPARKTPAGPDNNNNQCR